LKKRLRWSPTLLLEMKFTTAILALALNTVLASPVKEEERSLDKRGAVLTAQFATESEVDPFNIHLPPSSIDVGR
jgi:hypothetical protein